MIQRKTLTQITKWSEGKGIFATWGNAEADVPWKTDILSPAVLDLNYYGNHGNRYISPLVDCILGSSSQLTDANMLTIANAALTVYKQKWDRLYNTLSFEYNPIENYNMIETEESTGSKTIEGESSDTLSRQATTGTTATKDITDTLTKAGTETLTKAGSEAHVVDEDTTGTVSDTQHIYGFNSSTAVPSGSGTGSSGGTKDSTDTLTFTNRTDTTSFNSRTDTHVIDEDDSSTVTTQEGSGTNATHSSSEESEGGRTLTRSGNIGTVTAQDMILQEREVALFEFFDIVFKDLDRFLTIDTY